MTAIMRGNPSRNTRPERAVRSDLHRRGLRFRKDYPISTESINVRVDIVFTRRRIAVFIDGCFWHQCPEHGSVPRTNAEYWVPKLSHNVVRDREVDAALTRAGWRVFRFWEHVPATDAADSIAKVVTGCNGALTHRG